MLEELIYFLKYWSILELINWFIYLYIYINLISPKFMYYKNKDTEKIIQRINKLSKTELEYILKGSIAYDKINHLSIDTLNFNLEDLSKKEVINMIGFTLFGINIEKIYSSSKFKLIYNLLEKIEKKLNYNFKTNSNDRYLYKGWGLNYIKFNFRPLFIQVPLRIIINCIHYWFVYKLNFKYEINKNNKLSFLYKNNDSNKKTIFFIHGFGFGYIPYIQTLLELNKTYNLIIIILPNISSYTYYDDINYTYFPPLNDIKNSIYNFLEENNFNNIILLSHSFGTYITQILRTDSRSSIFNKIILVDPIIFWVGCFKMTLHVNNPLVRRYPYYQYIIDNAINFLIYQCIYLKYVCFRVMFGPDFWIYDASELLNTNVTIILEKGDYVIPAELLYNKIKNYVKCYYIDDDDALHGSIIIEKNYINKLIEIIEN